MVARTRRTLVVWGRRFVSWCGVMIVVPLVLPSRVLWPLFDSKTLAGVGGARAGRQLSELGR